MPLKSQLHLKKTPPTLDESLEHIKKEVRDTRSVAYSASSRLDSNYAAIKREIGDIEKKVNEIIHTQNMIKDFIDESRSTLSQNIFKLAFLAMVALVIIKIFK